MNASAIKETTLAMTMAIGDVNPLDILLAYRLLQFERIFKCR